MKQQRWQQRYENFARAFNLLQSVINERTIYELSDLEKEGLVQRFEYTFELAWKLLKDYLEFSGVNLEMLTPRYVIKQAFAAKLIDDGQAWINMLDHRNIMSHAYNQEKFEQAIKTIYAEYISILNKTYLFFKSLDND